MFKAGDDKMKMVDDTNLHKPKMIQCIECEEMVDKDDDYGIFAEDGYVCGDCYDYDREYAMHVTIYNEYDLNYDGYHNDDDGIVCLIGDYINETGGEFDKKYVALDGWRGYNEATSNMWTCVHEDASLAFSQNALDLEIFYEQFQDLMKACALPYAVVVAPTSNVFCTNVDFFVKNEDVETVKDLISDLVKVLRNPMDFTSTALTGADPEDQTPEDQFFALLASTLLA